MARPHVQKWKMLLRPQRRPGILSTLIFHDCVHMCVFEGEIIRVIDQKQCHWSYQKSCQDFSIRNGVIRNQGSTDASAVLQSCILIYSEIRNSTEGLTRNALALQKEKRHVYHGTCLSWTVVCLCKGFIYSTGFAGRPEGSYQESVLNSLNDVVMLKQLKRPLVFVCVPCIWCVFVFVCVSILLLGRMSKTLKRVQSTTKHLG